VLETIEKRIGTSNPVLAVASGTFKYGWNPGDAQLIRAMLPPHFPDKEVVINDVIVSLLEGRLDRSQIGAKIHCYIKAHNRMFPTDYARFAGRRLVSLDARLYDDGQPPLATRSPTGSGTRRAEAPRRDFIVCAVSAPSRRPERASRACRNTQPPSYSCSPTQTPS
jgi:hypothetical protein